MRRGLQATLSPAKYSYPVWVRDLVSGGPDLAFLEGREVQLKGLDGLHRLFAVELG